MVLQVPYTLLKVRGAFDLCMFGITIDFLQFSLFSLNNMSLLKTQLDYENGDSQSLAIT